MTRLFGYFFGDEKSNKSVELEISSSQSRYKLLILFLKKNERSKSIVLINPDLVPQAKKLQS